MLVITCLTIFLKFLISMKDEMTQAKLTCIRHCPIDWWLIAMQLNTRINTYPKKPTWPSLWWLKHSSEKFFIKQKLSRILWGSMFILTISLNFFAGTCKTSFNLENFFDSSLLWVLRKAKTTRRRRPTDQNKQIFLKF